MENETQKTRDGRAGEDGEDEAGNDRTPKVRLLWAWCFWAAQAEAQRTGEGKKGSKSTPAVIGRIAVNGRYSPVLPPAFITRNFQLEVCFMSGRGCRGCRSCRSGRCSATKPRERSRKARKSEYEAG